MLLVPAPPQLGQPLVPGGARLVVADEAAAVHPRRPALDGDHAVGHAREQLPVVTDEQNGLAGVEQPLLEPPLARDVEVVVRLVEQQHLVRPAQQRLEGQPLLLPAGQRRQLAVLAPLERNAQRGDGDGVPGDLGVVPADVAPVREGGGVGHLVALVVGLHERELGRVDGVPGLADGGRREVDQEPLHGRVVADRADELPHDAEPAGARDRPGLGDQVAGDDPQQGRLPRTVLTDQRGPGAVPDAEVDVVEQHPPVGKGVPDTGDVDVAHPDILASGASGFRATPPGAASVQRYPQALAREALHQFGEGAQRGPAQFLAAGPDDDGDRRSELGEFLAEPVDGGTDGVIGRWGGSDQQHAQSSGQARRDEGDRRPIPR